MKGLTMQKQEKPETTKASTGIPARVWVVLMLLCVLNVVAHLAAMPGLPERIPMHWGADGGVNGWGPRWMASVLGALPLTFLALFYVVPRIDPKGAAYAKFGGFYQGFVISFTVFMCAISWLGELTVWNLLPGKGAVNVIVSGAIGAFFIGICENLLKGMKLTAFSDAFTFALLIIILVVKPTGLFGEKLTEKV